MLAPRSLEEGQGRDGDRFPGRYRATAGLQQHCLASRMITLRRRDPARRIARAYRIALQADLLDGWAVVREWGRIGSPGQVRADNHEELSLV
jgi:WGR domain